jgi:hypothetical protein
MKSKITWLLCGAVLALIGCPGESEPATDPAQAQGDMAFRGSYKLEVLVWDPANADQPLRRAGSSARTGCPKPDLADGQLLAVRPIEPPTDDMIADIKAAGPSVLLLPMDATDEHLERIGELGPSITHVVLWSCGQVTPAGLAHLAKLPSLTHLRCTEQPTGSGGDRWSGAGIEALAKIETLEYLDFTGMQISASDLAGLSGLPRLKYLYASVQPSHEIEAGTLGDAKGLTHLSLGFMTDARLRAVAESLPGLEYLWVHADRVTPDGLAHLHGLQDLKYVRLDPEIAAAGRSALEAALPECQVDAAPWGEDAHPWESGEDKPPLGW